MAWEKLDEEVTAYMSGELTETEKEAFEKRLQTDLDLAAAMERYDSFEQTLNDYGDHKKQVEHIAQLRKQFTPKKPLAETPEPAPEETPKSVNEKRWKLIKYLSIAAAIVLFFTFIFVFSGNQQYCPEELYTEAFSVRAAPNYAGQGPKATAEQILTQANDKFNQKSYDKAIELYQRSLDAGTLGPGKKAEAHFYFGQSLMTQEDFEGAISNFDSITKGQFSQLSTWYLALSYLAMGQVEKTRSILEAIAKKTAHDRYEEAGTLLEKLEKVKEC